jgi:dipeptidyl aminopeptidase/acylaminoacyl peptidase
VCCLSEPCPRKNSTQRAKPQAPRPSPAPLPSLGEPFATTRAKRRSAPGGADPSARQLTSNGDFDSAPSWSPDGKRIVFERAPAGTFVPGTEAQEKDVYVMNADGTDVRRLTSSPGLDEGPEFSPDATKVVFSSARDGQQEIYVMDADGSNPRRLTDNPSRDESPDWQALPFDGRGHRACGDVSVASGGASSVLAMRVPCHVALRLAARWARAADAGDAKAALHGLACTATQQPYDLTVVDCAARKRRCARDVAFVWRDPSRAPASAVAPQAPAAPKTGADRGADRDSDGSYEVHEA